MKVFIISQIKKWIKKNTYYSNHYGKDMVPKKGLEELLDSLVQRYMAMRKKARRKDKALNYQNKRRKI